MEEIFINIDSKYRDQNLYPNEAKFRFNLEKTYKNIGSITINSLEINNSISYISSTKQNNYITVHLPNKLNDPEGTPIILYDGLLQSIKSIQSVFNEIFNKMFNSNLVLQQKQFAEKYFYIFYLNNQTNIHINFIDINNIDINLDNPLSIPKGWHSIYGLVIQIQNFIIETNNITKIKSFTVNEFTLDIFDRRVINCIRQDTITPISSNGDLQLNNNLQLSLDNLKTHIYTRYVNDIITFKPSTSSNGILDELIGNSSKSLYHINNSTNNPNSESIQLYNLSLDIDHTISRAFFTNSFTDTENLETFYYYNGDNRVRPGTDTISNGWYNLSNLLNRTYLYNHYFITETEYNDPLYIPSLDKDIPEYEINFNTSKRLEDPLKNPVTDGLLDIKKLEYPSVGYYMGYRPNMSLKINKFLKSSILDHTNRIIRAEKIFDTSGDNYIFIKINNWGYINFFGEQFMAKILLTSVLSPILDAYVNQCYRFRQPININRLDIELVDYLGNTLDTNGTDFSISIQFNQFISSDQKVLSEKQAVVFNY